MPRIRRAVRPLPVDLERVNCKPHVLFIPVRMWSVWFLWLDERNKVVDRKKSKRPKGLVLGCTSSEFPCSLHMNLGDFHSGKAYSSWTRLRYRRHNRRHVEHHTTRQVMKIRATTAGMLCFVALTTGACVMSSTYNEAVADLDATKAEVDSTRTQSKVLTEQVNELLQLKVELARQKEEISLTLQQAKQSMQAEHAASQTRLNRLTQTIGQLSDQQRRLLYALQRANDEQPALQSMVEEYKSKLGAAEGSRAQLSPTPISPANGQAETAIAPPSQVAVQTAPNPIVTAPANPVNPKPQPANKPTTEPVEDDWLTVLKGWILAFWQSIFS